MCCPTALASLQLAGIPARKGACLPPLPSPLPMLPPQALELLPWGDASPLPSMRHSDQSTPLPKAVEEHDCPCSVKPC